MNLNVYAGLDLHMFTLQCFAGFYRPSVLQGLVCVQDNVSNGLGVLNPFLEVTCCVCIDNVRGQPLIIWGDMVQIEKKNCSEACRKKKIMFRGSPKKKKIIRGNPHHAPPHD